jgi:RimJ/RimL family protein N-acetyltransferase
MSELLLDRNPLGENYAVLLRSDVNPSDSQSQDAESDTVLKAGGFLGWVGTWKSEPVAEVGFIFHQSAWGFGFATEALNAFVQLYWRVKPQFDALEAYCDTENEASVKVLRKSGFVFVESIVGDYVLPWMKPSLRSSLRFRATRPLIETPES